MNYILSYKTNGCTTKVELNKLQADILISLLEKFTSNKRKILQNPRWRPLLWGKKENILNNINIFECEDKDSNLTNLRKDKAFCGFVKRCMYVNLIDENTYELLVNEIADLTSQNCEYCKSTNLVIFSPISAYCRDCKNHTTII